MNPAPLCSVCIANYNGEAMLRECIDSVLAQDDIGAIEIVVHDDASSDRSLAVLRDAYPQIRVLASETNVGFCVANNRMVTQARGEFVLLLNNDAALMPGAVRALIDAARVRAEPAIFTLPQYDWQNGGLVDRGCLLDPFYNPVPNHDPGRAEVAMTIGACMFLPRSLWDELGGFPEWMESIGEDLYLCCLARLRSYPVIALNASGYRHRRGVSFSGERNDANRLVTTFRRRRLSERNKTAVLFICTPTPLMWPLLALHSIALSIEALLLVCVKREPAIWREIYGTAFCQAWSERRTLMQRRTAIQALRQISLGRYMHLFRPLPHKLIMLWRHGLPAIRR